jgi:hypothetical protein
MFAQHVLPLELVHWLGLVQTEYREMPGLNLTARQIQRLWGLDRDFCETLVNALVDAHVLRVTRAGTYIAFSHSEPVLDLD